MKNWIFNLVSGALIMLLVFLNFKQCSENKDLKHSVSNQTKEIKVTYKNKPISPPVAYIEKEVPKEIIVYKEKEVVIDSVIYRDNEILIYVQDSLSLKYPGSFLTLYPKSDKLIFMDLGNKDLSLGLVTSDKGETIEKKFSVNTSRYSYRYVDNELTVKKKPWYTNFGFSSEYMYRPLNQYHDFNLGVNYKTGYFKYELGMNIHSYPIGSYNFGWGPYFKLKLDF